MPRTARAITVHPLRLRRTEVVRVDDLTPGMRRVTVTGPELQGFVSIGFDDWVRLFFAYPGESEPVVPVVDQGRLRPPVGRRPLGRVYSVRRWDADLQELDLDFVVHGVGVATTWAERVQPGDSLVLAGPNSSLGLPVADELLVVGDETALPAIARLLEELPSDACAQVFIETAAQSHRQQLRELPGVRINWLSRDGVAAGTSSLLSSAVRSVDRWPPRTFAWVAGEQSVVRDIRRHLLEERGFAKQDVEFTGYWKRSTVVASADDAAVPDPQGSRTAYERFHDLAELIPPVALRVAADLGIGDLISRGVTDTDELAARTHSDPRALAKLLRYLHSIDIVHPVGQEGYDLTEVGESLASDVWVDALSSRGVLGRQNLGVLGLAQSVRTGRSSYASVTGQEFSEVRREQTYEDRFLERVAQFQPAIATPIATSGLLSGACHVVLHSGGAGAQAKEFTTAHPHLRVTICALPAQADWLRRDLVESIVDDHQRSRVLVVEQSLFEPSPRADVVFIIRALGSLPDADAAFALRRASENLTGAGRVLLIEDTFDPGDPDEHQAEADLIALTRDGGGLRTEAELFAVIDRAGLRKRTVHTVGWGMQIHELVLAEDPHQRTARRERA